MRKVLLRIIFDKYWYLDSVGNELWVGAGWVLIFWALIAAVGLLVLWRMTKDSKQLLSSLIFWGIIPTLILLVPVFDLPFAHSGIPIFGYGFMLFVGFSTASFLAGRRAKLCGLDPNVIWDLMMWLLIPGIIGARIVFLIQNSDRVFAGKSGIEMFKAAVALYDGGIVFYGSIIGGVIGMMIFCRQRKIRPLLLGDIIMPSLFIGLGFGRIGCFLYGCCYGGECDLPWAVQFPSDSLAFNALVMKGIVSPDATETIPLHPTQIYSSVLAFLLAGFLMWYFRRRAFEGAVLGLGWTIYPINRFILESIRNDEPTRFGTVFTFSQLMSIGLFISGCGLLYWLHRRNATSAGAENSET